MRIAQIAPCWLNVPPDRYGGIEYVVSLLADGFVERGHDVTLFATRAAKTKAKLCGYYERPLGTLVAEDALLELPHVIASYSRAPDFDIVHDHTFLGMGIAIGAQLPNTVVVNTLHVPVAMAPFLKATYELLSGRVNLVAISEAQRAGCPDLRYAATIHHGIPLSLFRYRESKEDFLLFVGRMSEDKGPHLAIQAANKLGRRLKLGFKLTTPKEKAYYEAVVKPLVTPNIEVLGELDFSQKVDLYSRACATLMPAQWPEPFGLVAIESLASGTPVVAWRNGALPEIVEHGVSGFIAGSAEELVDGIRRIDGISPAACRRRAERYFSVEAMLDGYEALFRALLADR
ncbi:MAG: glycosyltransferase family 4 protein [Gammaproteobacteria bacterium]